MWPRGQKFPERRTQSEKNYLKSKAWRTDTTAVKDEKRDGTVGGPTVAAQTTTMRAHPRPNAWGISADAWKSKSISPLQKQSSPQPTQAPKVNAWGQTQQTLKATIATPSNAKDTPAPVPSTLNGQMQFPALLQPQQSVKSNTKPATLTPSVDKRNQDPALSQSISNTVPVKSNLAIVTNAILDVDQNNKKGKKRKPKFGESISTSIGDLIPKNHVLLRKKKAPAPSNSRKENERGISSTNAKVQFSRLAATSAPFIPSSEFPALVPTSSSEKSSALIEKQEDKAKSFAPPKTNATKKQQSSPNKIKKKKQKQKSTAVIQSRDEVPKMDAFHSAATLSGFSPTGGVGLGSADNGGQFDLLRLYGDGKMKGRQRIRPRKKKFSSLKKKVLEERLRRWKDQHPIEKEDTQAAESLEEFMTVCLYGFCHQDELEDDDEYEEIVANLLDMANKLGATKRVFIPRTMGSNDRDKWPTFVEFEKKSSAENAAAAAVQCWNGLILGGQELKCCPMTLVDTCNVDEKQAESDAEWQEWCLSVERVNMSKSMDATIEDSTGNGVQQRTDVILENALTEDDLEDEECLEESLTDIRAIASKFGEVASIKVVEGASPHVRLVYAGDISVARQAVLEFSKVVIGGLQVSARLADASAKEEPDGNENVFFIRIHNVLTEDDREDEECLEESLNDVRELAQQFGQVIDVVLDAIEEPAADQIVNNSLRVYFSTSEEAKAASKGFDGMVIGGSKVSASEGYDRDPESVKTGSLPADKSTEPMFSGDKIIPERFAACKRVPKIVNQQAPRQYATLAVDEAVKPLLVEMLGELMRLQRRAIEEKNTKAKRRLVMGLREVARGIRSHKVKMVVMANNLDEYGVIDEKLQEIIDLAHSEGVPVFYEFTKRTLGKAIGKSIKIAVVGVQNAEGAHQQFKKLLNLATKLEMV